MTETSPTPTRGDSFPRQYARTVRFSLGVPTGFTIAPDGGQALFLRAPSGSDRAVCLWSIDLATGAERLLADPSVLLDGGTEDLTPEERARRERSRQAAGGIVGYGTDSAVRTAVFTLSSRLFLVDVASGAIRELAAAGPVIDPRIDPTGRRVAYVTGNALHVLTLGTDGAPDTDVALAVPEHELISYGLAEFVAAEEMDRSRGYWWAPDGDRLLVARVDETPVKIVYLSDPANPEQPPVAWRYPMTGTANAVVTAHVFGVDGTRVDVEWDNDAFCYLTTAHWSAGGAPLIAVQDRAQHVIQVLAIDPATGATKPVAEERDEIWTDIHPGVPAWTEDGRLVRVAPRDDRNRVLVDERPVTGTDLHVRGVIAVGAHDVTFSASAADPTQVHLYQVSFGAAGDESASAVVRALTTEPGVHRGAIAGDVLITSSAGLAEPGWRTVVRRVTADAVLASHEIASLAERPLLRADVRMLTLGARELRAGLLLPSGHTPGEKLPVLLMPYGGPHGQMVQSAHNIFLSPRWYAEQGFAVLVVDGRGSPGRGYAWERAVLHRFAEVPLEDQVDALHAAAEQVPELDLSRVAMSGWSFGGYLSALAVLRRPDVFHAAVVGAPVTEHRLYDTHYKERYLGHPYDDPNGAEVYDRNSALTNWAEPHRPMLIIHGLVDDNVLIAHSLRLSGALLAAGRPHEMLPLTGVTHMATRDEVAENLMHFQVDFLKRSLGMR